MQNKAICYSFVDLGEEISQSLRIIDSLLFEAKVQVGLVLLATLIEPLRLVLGLNMATWVKLIFLVIRT